MMARLGPIGRSAKCSGPAGSALASLRALRRLWFNNTALNLFIRPDMPNGGGTTHRATMKNIDEPAGARCVAANDNVKRRTIEPFHRLFAEGKLHRTPAVNTQLYYAGLRYRKSYSDAGGNSTAPPIYSGSLPPEYDPYRQVRRTSVDKSRPYFDAAKILDGLGLRELVESIVVRAEKVEEAGKRYRCRRHKEQGRCAAQTALGIGLRALRNHYDDTAIERAA
jgi:hypothetical protein